MAVQLYGRVGIGNILVGIHKTGLHFQLLKKVAGIDAKLAEILVELAAVCLRWGIWKVLRKFPDIG